MKTATWASSRTAAGAQKSLNQGLQVAFRSGAVMGLTVVGLGLLDITLWFAFLYWVWPMISGSALTLIEITVTMLCFGMGASAQALFARVGGGIFTKAADVGADLVGKVEQGIPEDDPRNPATIADNVGDNVGDVAGMGADLYESYCGSILATAALGVAAYSSRDLLPEGIPAVAEQMHILQLQALFLPMAIAGVGIFLSIFGIFMVRTSEDATQKNLLSALARGINLSTLLVFVAAIVLAMWLMPHSPGTVVNLGGVQIPGVAFSVITGLMAGWLIGKWTEYSTSDEYKPTKGLAEQALTGPATIIIGGIAEGMMSVWVPVVVVCAARWSPLVSPTAGTLKTSATSPSGCTASASRPWACSALSESHLPRMLMVRLRTTRVAMPKWPTWTPSFVNVRTPLTASATPRRPRARALRLARPL
jgi:K(+)-stimulated pyrophosphate-energized sodium pump